MSQTGLFTRRVRVAVAASMLLLAGACGSSGSGSRLPSITSPPTTAPPPVLTVGELTDALLTISDLPPGWSKSMTDSESSTAASYLCPDGATAERTENHPTAGVMFQQSDMGPMLLQQLASAADADAHFADVKRVFDSCLAQTWYEDLGDVAVPVSLVEVSGATVGQRSMSYRISGSDSESAVAMTMDFTIVGRSTVIELYASVKITSPYVETGQLSPVDFAALVAEGDAKVIAAVDAASGAATAVS